MRRRRLIPFAAALWLAALAPVAHAQPAPLAGLDSYIEAAMQQWHVPGLAIAVVRNDSVIYARGFGVRELGRAELVDEHTLFAVASTTKAMTVAGLGMLVDEGRLGWDDAVAKYLPGLQLGDAYVTRELTVRDLLTHRSGIARSDNLWIAGPFDRAEVLRRARYLPQSNAFRTTYGYQNIMYIAAGELLGAVAGVSWDQFMEERVFRPLGMRRSTTRADVVATRDNVASSHIRVDGQVEAVERRNYDNIGGAGAAFSSVYDMAQWLRMHLNGGTYRGMRLLDEATLREIHSPQTVMRSDTVAQRLFPSTHFRAYGLGWNLQDYHGRKLVHHSGSLNWTRTQVGMVPEEGIGVVVIANLSSSNLQRALMYRVLDALMNLPPTDWSAEYLTLANRSGGGGTDTADTRVPGTTPSLALAGYAGSYTSELYGDLQLSVEGGRLVLRYAPDYIADLEHWHHDTFRARWRRRGFGSAMMTFGLDHRGRAASFELAGFGSFRRAAPQEASRRHRTFFIGRSDFGHSGGIPIPYEEVCALAGTPCKGHRHWDFTEHDPRNGLPPSLTGMAESPHVQRILRTEPFDAVFLSFFASNTEFYRPDPDYAADVRAGATSLYRQITANGARPFVYVGYATLDNPGDSTRIDAGARALQVHLDSVARNDATPRAVFVPVRSFAAALAAELGADRWFDDPLHPSELGQYAIARLLFACVSGRDPAAFPHPSRIAADDAARIDAQIARLRASCDSS
jgi:CubicO group peptidase (beta-lactamase class C family)